MRNPCCRAEPRLPAGVGSRSMRRPEAARARGRVPPNRPSAASAPWSGSRYALDRPGRAHHPLLEVAVEDVVVRGLAARRQNDTHGTTMQHERPFGWSEMRSAADLHRPKRSCRPTRATFSIDARSTTSGVNPPRANRASFACAAFGPMTARAL